jgi:hypothetical protein
MLRPAIALLPLLAGGCGAQSKRIELHTTPPGGVIVVLDDPAAEAFLVLKNTEKLAKAVLRLLKPHLDEPTMERVSKLDVAELICRVLSALHVDMIPPEDAAEARAMFARLPGLVRKDLASAVGLEEFGVAPLRLKTRAARTYVVIAWKPGRRPQIDSINPFKAKKGEILLTLRAVDQGG